MTKDFDGSYSEELKHAEEQAIEFYEKGSKPYRRKSISIPKQIMCQKCGSTHNLMKLEYKGEDFWFCRKCVYEKYNEEARKLNMPKNNKIIGEM